MRERGSGHVISCAYEPVDTALGGSFGAFLRHALYEVRVEIAVGEATIPLRRLQAGPPRSAAGDTLMVEWQNRKLWRVVNQTTGEVLLDRTQEAIAMAAVGAALLLVIGAAAAAILTSR